MPLLCWWIYLLQWWVTPIIRLPKLKMNGWDRYSFKLDSFPQCMSFFIPKWLHIVGKNCFDCGKNNSSCTKTWISKSVCWKNGHRGKGFNIETNHVCKFEMATFCWEIYFLIFMFWYLAWTIRRDKRYHWNESLSSQKHHHEKGKIWIWIKFSHWIKYICCCSRSFAEWRGGGGIILNMIWKQA